MDDAPQALPKTLTKRILGLAILALSCIVPKLHAQTCVTQSQVTLAGNLRGGNGIPSSNYTLSFRPSQQGYIAGCGVNLPTTFACATSTDGSVVGLPNPLTTTSNTTAGTGSLTSGIYYSVYAWVDAAGHVTLVSPESQTQLSSTGSVVNNPPTSGAPSGATARYVYMSTSPGTETLQGSANPGAAYVQATALQNGLSPQSSNTTLCQLTANDAIWPVGTGYITSLTDSNGNAVPSYPMQWQLNGPGTTINLSNGLPYYHGVVQFPVPLLVQPQNHGQQFIGGPLNFGGYNAVNLGKVGVGTSTPAWGIDVIGLINSTQGYLFNGGAGTTGQCLVSNGTAFVPGTCAIPSGQPYYFHWANNTIFVPSEAFANFSSRFTLTDNPGGGRTDLELSNSGVTAGSYTNPSISVDQYGRVTSASNGNAIPAIKTKIVTSGICTTPNSAYANCSFTVSWPSSFVDAGYSATCTSGPGQGSSAVLTGLFVSNKTASNFQVTLQNGTASGAGATTVSEIDCTGVHP